MPETDPAGASSDEQTTPARPRRLWLFVVIALVVVALDVITKALVVAKLTNHAPVRLIGGAIFLVETRNSGAAFSVGTGATLVLTVVALIVVVVIARAARRMRSIVWSIALGLIFGGAVGNLIDRIFRAPGVGRGHVVDWISLFSDDGHPWPIFNLADSAIVCGAITAALVAIIGIDVDGTRRR
ncbi:MAG: signal peptidase II [Actinobacteria bacterium]|nr:signal peptidase II [Actinomycetota bacterium]